jgi:predicted metal-dependent phosphoesterase TrpH
LASELPTFDLQSHSQQSDGELPPRGVVAAAAEAGVELLALTDHDTVAGVEEAAAAAEELGIRLVPSVEISAIDAHHGDLHILGYGLNVRDPLLLERLEHYLSQRRARARTMVEAIRALGFELDEGLLARRAEQGKSIGRPHLAMAVIRQPSNAERLKQERCTDPSAFLEAYLVEGRPAFRPRVGPSIDEAIAAIHEARGVAVWAHPFFDVFEPSEVLEAIERFRAAGIDGVECFYPTHTRKQSELLADRCDALGLLSTGSSDFHGPRHRELSRFRAFSTYGRAPRLGPIAQ